VFLTENWPYLENGKQSKNKKVALVNIVRIRKDGISETSLNVDTANLEFT